MSHSLHGNLWSVLNPPKSIDPSLLKGVGIATQEPCGLIIITPSHYSVINKYSLVNKNSLILNTSYSIIGLLCCKDNSYLKLNLMSRALFLKHKVL